MAIKTVRERICSTFASAILLKIVSLRDKPLTPFWHGSCFNDGGTDLIYLGTAGDYFGAAGCEKQIHSEFAGLDARLSWLLYGKSASADHRRRQRPIGAAERPYGNGAAPGAAASNWRSGSTWTSASARRQASSWPAAAASRTASHEPASHEPTSDGSTSSGR